MYLMTQRGHDKLRQRIDELHNNLGKVMLERGAIEGGFHENASAEENKRQVDMLRFQITDLKKTLREAKIVQPTNDGKVAIGSTVIIENQDGSSATWSIGGYLESDPDNSLVAYDTPLGSALMGAEIGSTVTVNGREWTVNSIE